MSREMKPDGQSPQIEKTGSRVMRTRKEKTDNTSHRINQMEDILDSAIRKMDELERKIAEYREFQSEIRKLEAYYTSQQWKDDLAADEAGTLPKDLKRGVLSEDGIWNVLERNKEMLEMISARSKEGSMNKVYCYSKCTTCKKALKWLEDNRIEHTVIDIKSDHPDEKTLREYHKKSGLPLRKFFNTSGQLYREMELSKKLPDMSEDEMFKLLASDGMLVKRPLLITEDTVLAGFKEAEWKEAL